MSELTKEEFVIRAIKKLRNPSRSKGIHSVYSGFNVAFQDYFGEEARLTTDKMVAEHKLEVQPRKGGVMMYLPGEAPLPSVTSETVLKKMELM